MCFFDFNKHDGIFFVHILICHLIEVISDYNDKIQAIVPVKNNQIEAGWGSVGVIILP